MESYLPILHHDATGGFDGYTAIVVVAVLVAVAGLGFGIWYLLRKRRYG